LWDWWPLLARPKQVDEALDTIAVSELFDQNVVHWISLESGRDVGRRRIPDRLSASIPQIYCSVGVGRCVNPHAVRRILPNHLLAPASDAGPRPWHP
jgi:hypothetical protein